MNELMKIDVNELTLDQLGSEVRLLTSQARTMVLAYGVEIGRRLAAAKEKVPYGQWGAWIAAETEYSQSTAGRFIKLWEEYGAAQGSLFGAEVESSTLKKLSVSNALRLLAIPEEEREEFAIEVDAEHISARELDEAIRARKAAEERADKLELQLEGRNSRVKELEEEAEEADWQLDEARSRIKELESRPVEVAVQIDEEAVEKAAREAREAVEKKAKEEREKLERELKEAREKLSKAEAARDKAILESANAGEADKWKKEAREAKAALDAAERKLKAGGAAEVAALCRIAQDNFYQAVEKLRELDKETAGKLTEGMKQILKSLLGKLGVEDG